MVMHLRWRRHTKINFVLSGGIQMSHTGSSQANRSTRGLGRGCLEVDKHSLMIWRAISEALCVPSC